MFFAQPVFRPPSESDSLLVQVTVGCSRPSCKFCFCSLLSEHYVRDREAILGDIAEAGAKYADQVQKVFFLLASALGAPTETLCAASERCRTLFSGLRTISCYAHPLDILHKTDEELRAIREAGLSRLYIGIESGSDEVLRSIHKGGSSKQIERACTKASAAGFTLSCQVIIGLGGTKLTRAHAEGTARLLSEVAPQYLGFLNLMVVPRTGLECEIEAGEFEVLDNEQYLLELERIITLVEPHRPIVVRTNHPSNHLSLRGTLPDDREEMLGAIRSTRTGAVPFNEEFLRNL